MNMYTFILVLILGVSLSGCEHKTAEQPTLNTPAEPSESVDMRDWLSNNPSVSAQFKRAIEPRTFIFPQDHLAHQGYQIEWWYITGNLSTTDNTPTEQRDFGYQVTFFRIALTPETLQRRSNWASHYVWMAHVALSDISAKQHYHDERLSREAVGLAGVRTQPFKVWLDDWHILGQTNNDFPWKIHINTAHFSLDLKVQTTKPVVLQGNQGLSQKSKEKGNASYYYSFTRLATEGHITSQNNDKPVRYAVKGTSWLDREWSTSALGQNQAGWNWFSLQLKDGTDIMFYQLHNKDGSIDPVSSGKWVFADGQYEAISHKDIILTPISHWQSSSGKHYVTEWTMDIPKYHAHWRVKAVFPKQEMLTSVRYWEGAVRVFDKASGEFLGQGYLEMTGY